ncbi:MAG TPA: isocitrate/isopropylmalate dehydrogenase family protein [Thermoanaerobaculia bacterium]|nr:isocitrate/isopropylmalate dehydrogenase family protein [Thermoanaerobaculia bacterium]
MTSRHRTATLVPGDGIGPEITAAVVGILEAAGAPIVWERHDAGEAAVRATGSPLPPDIVASIQRTKVCLKGPVTTPVGGGYKSVNVSLRQSLDLYANLRPVRNLPGVPSRYGDLDLVVVRENTEDLYSGIEHVVVPGVVESIKVITEKASTRIARFAFEYARTHGRRKVTAVHKANIMKLSDGLFLDCFRAVASEYADIAADDVIVDAACMKLVMNPRQFDVLLLENLYGDIISDLASGLVGGLGVTPGANLGTRCAVFESVHGSAPDIAGKGIANPTALLLSATMLLRHVGENGRAERIERALDAAMSDGSARTRDVGGTATTAAYAKAVVAHL